MTNRRMGSAAYGDFRSCEHPCNASGLLIYLEENDGSDPQKQVVKVTDFTVTVLNCDTAVSKRFWNVSVSSRSCEFETSSSAIAEKPRCSVGQFWVAITPYSADRLISAH